MSSVRSQKNNAEDDAQSPWRSGHLMHVAGVLVLMGGVIVSLVLYQYRLNREVHFIDAQFTRDVEKFVAALDREVDIALGSHGAMAGLYDASERVEAHEFNAFARRILVTRPAIDALAWWPRDGDSDEHPKVASGFFETAGEDLSAHGIETAAMRDLLGEACDSGDAAAGWCSPKYDADGQWRLVNLIPIFARDMPHATTEQRRKALAGVLVAWINLKRVFDCASHDAGRTNIRSWIYEGDVPMADHWCLGDGGYMPWSALPVVIRKPDTLQPLPVAARTISVGQRQWTVVNVATHHYVSKRRTSETWEVLVSGVVISMLLALLVGAFGNHAARMSLLAIDRGTQLQVAQHTINSNAQSLEAARLIQFQLFPEVAPSIPGYQIHAATHAAEAVDGDFYDYLTFPDGSLGVVIGDACGHGLPAAMLSTRAQGAIRSLSRISNDIAFILREANRALLGDPANVRFITLLLLRMDIETGKLQYSNAGHPAGVVLDRHGNIRHQLDSTSEPLGIDETVNFVVGPSVTLEPGDLLFLATDGVMEAWAQLHTQFSNQPVLDVVRRHLNESPKQIINAVQRAIITFSGGVPAYDDITALVVRRVD